MDINAGEHSNETTGLSRLTATGWGGGGTAKVVLRLKRRLVLVEAAEIDCIDGAANYVRINVGSTAHRVRSTLGEIERALPADRFLRLQRSTIVNLAAVRELVRGPYGDLAAVLANGRRLTVGRAYRHKVVAAIARARP
jgi:two-component system, LytTR family, response regulator